MLTCYRLARVAEGDGFDSFVDDEELKTLAPGRDQFGDQFDARVYYRTPEEKFPAWVELLTQPFPNLAVVQGRAPSALLLVRVNEAKSEAAKAAGAFFAFPFGPQGRFWLKPERIVHGFGLRVALNVIYPSGSDARARLRAVDRKRHGATVVRSRSQASQQADLEMFGVNQLRDVLDRATGSPSDSFWGSAVSGSDSFALNAEVRFADLGELCIRMDAAYELDDYKDRFGWIDNIKPVTDKGLVETLSDLVVGHLKAGAGDLHLGPPDWVDWDRLDGFRFELKRTDDEDQPSYKDLMLDDYVDAVGMDALAKLSLASLQRHRVVALEGADRIAAWPVWRCLVAELKHDEKTYLLESGQFFNVDTDYLDDLNEVVDAIKPSTLTLPDSNGDTEEVYNKRAAKGGAFLLLDRKTVKVDTRTTSIELCDLLTRDGDLIHVKRHLSSSSLSHLFGQGLVSAELLQSNVEFRKKAKTVVAQQAKRRAREFDLFDEGSLLPSDFTVVFAIAADWDGRTMAQALPFFSKVNLREVFTNLDSRGFNVRLHQITAPKKAVVVKKAPAKKAPAQKAPAQKAAARKPPAKKTAGKKT